MINGVIVGTKQDGDARVKHLKKKIAIMKNQEFDNGSLKVSLDEVTEENVRLNLLQERLEEDDGRQGSTIASWFRQFKNLLTNRNSGMEISKPHGNSLYHVANAE